jgi:hypothetical protein
LIRGEWAQAMSVDYISGNTTDGLTLKLYRGEDMVLLAFDIDDTLKTPDFVGFGIQYFLGDSTQPRDVFNFLTFKHVRLKAKAAKKHIKLAARASLRSPIQQFRWAHVPSVPLDGPVTYQVSAMFWNGTSPLVVKSTTRATIDAHRATRGAFLNVGFTRGFASSQAYERNFPDEHKIMPAVGKPQLNFNTAPFEGEGRPYPWLGFEARRILFEFLDECQADPEFSPTSSPTICPIRKSCAASRPSARACASLSTIRTSTANRRATRATQPRVS